MLAGAKSIDAVIDAAAGIIAAREIANFHVIATARGRAHAERSERTPLRFQRLDSCELGTAAPTPQIKLVLVAGSPTEYRRLVENPAGAPFGRLLFLLSRHGRVSKRLRRITDRLALPGRLARDPNE
jgi:hypothetical protein